MSPMQMIVDVQPAKNIPRYKKLIPLLINPSRRQFTGRLDIKSHGQKWSLYLNLGRLVWASGGIHPHWRWQRHLSLYCPQVKQNEQILTPKDGFECLDYELLTILAQRRLVSIEQMLKVIRGTILEVLFEVIQAIEIIPFSNICTQGESTYESAENLRIDAKHIRVQWQPGVRPSHGSMLPPSCMLKVEPILLQSLKDWNCWVQSNLKCYSPNCAPVIRQKALLQEQTSSSVYKVLIKLCNGKRSLRDLALITKKDLFILARVLFPYISRKLITLVNIPDIKHLHLTNSLPNSLVPTSTRGGFGQPLIAYIDDSEHACLMMRKIVENSGCRFLGISEAVKALPQLLKYKPSLIFLDLVMPIANGYEICSQIRRIYQFQRTPVVILSGHDGVVDRVRAKMVGATDFLSKPIENKKVIEVLHKHQIKKIS